MRLRLLFVLLGGATLTLGASSVAFAQSPCITGVEDCSTPTPTQAPTPTPGPCIPGLNCPRPTASPTPQPTPEPTIARTATPRATETPTPSATAAEETDEPTPTPTITPTPTPTPTPPTNRGLAVLGLFGSGGMIGSAAWIWRRYLS